MENIFVDIDIIFCIWFGFVFILAILISNIAIKESFPFKYNELKIEEKLIKKIKGNVSIGKKFWFSVTYGWFIDIFIYEKSLVIKYFGRALRYEYNKEKMYFESYLMGIIPYLVMEIEHGKIWIFLWSDERNLLQELINKNSK